MVKQIKEGDIFFDKDTEEYVRVCENLGYKKEIDHDFDGEFDEKEIKKMLPCYLFDCEHYLTLEDCLLGHEHDVVQLVGI